MYVHLQLTCCINLMLARATKSQRSDKFRRCIAPLLGCSAARAHLFHLLRQRLFHSANIFHVNCTLALSNHRAETLSPVWPGLHWCPDKPHKYYPSTTNPILRAVKTSKPTALSVFITLGQDTNRKKWEKKKREFFCSIRVRPYWLALKSHLNFSAF